MRELYLASVSLHVLAAMTWVGGMIVFVAAMMPYYRRRSDAERTDFLGWFGARFRAVSWVCFAILVSTGTFNLWARGVRAGDFLRPAWHATTFGRLVMIKLTLVAIAIAISAVHERVQSRASARWMGRSLLLLAIAIVVVAVLLVRPPTVTIAGPAIRGGDWFAQTGCTACHSVSSYNLHNLAATGPDLSLAVEDVPRRFGVAVDDFLRAPSGTMAIVLNSRIPLTTEQRALAAERLKEAYQRHQDMAREIRDGRGME